MIRAAAEYAAELLAGHDNPAVGLSVPSPVDPVTGEFGARRVSDVLRLLTRELIAGMLAARLSSATTPSSPPSRRPAWVRGPAALGTRSISRPRSTSAPASWPLAARTAAASATPASIGHLTVRDMGPLSRNRGSARCLGAFLMPSYFGALLEKPTEERLIALAARGARGSPRRALLDAGRLIGRTVAVVCDLLNPAVVVVGGRFTEPGDHVIDGIRESLQSNTN